MKKLIQTALFTLCMLMALFPMAALADPVTTEYDLWVNNEQITAANLTVQCGDGTAVYDPAENTLTLNHAEITEGCLQDQWLYSGIVSFLPDLEIVLVGDDNTITNTGGEGISTYDTDADYKCIRHDLKISGDGKLTIAQNTAYVGYGIYCTGGLVLDGVTLDIDTAATGLWAQWRLDIADCDIDIDVHSGYYGMLTNIGGSAPAADKANGKGMITVTNSKLDIDSTTTGELANGVVTDSAILIGSSDAVGALVVNSGSLILKSGGHTVQGGIDTSDPPDEVADVFATVTVNGGTIKASTSGTGVQAFNLPAANVILHNGEAVTAGALDGVSRTISPTYTVTVEGSTVDNSGAGKYVAGETVTLRAGSRVNYTFAGWTSADVDSITDKDKASASFIMPAKSVTVTANWLGNPVAVSYDANGGSLSETGKP